MEHRQFFFFGFSILAACLLPRANGQFAPTRHPTSTPTLPPTPHPMTINCNLTAYKELYAVNESCYACRNNYQCAWCMPDSGAVGFCFNNMNAYCPGRSGSYSDTICQPPLQVSAAVVAIIVTVLLLLCCCGGACCFYASKNRRNRNLMQTNVGVGGVMMTMPPGNSMGMGQPPLVYHQQQPQQPLQAPYSSTTVGGYPGGSYYAAPQPTPMPTPYTTHPGSSYYSSYPPPMSTAPPPPPGSMSPPPPSAPPYGKYV